MDYRNMFHLIKNYKWRSFFLKCGIVVLLPTILVFASYSMLLFRSYSQYQRQEQMHYQSQLLSKIMYGITSVFDEMDTFTARISKDLSADIFFASDREHFLSVTDYALKIKQDISFVTDNSQIISSIYLYGMKNGYVISTSSHFNSNYAEQFQDMGWYPAFEDGKRMFTHSVSFFSTNYEYLTVCIPLYYRNRLEGAIVYNLDYNKILELCLPSGENADDIYLISGEGNILVCKNRALSNCPVSTLPELDKAYQRIIDSGSGYFSDSDRFSGMISPEHRLVFLSEWNNAAYQKPIMNNIRSSLLIGMLIFLLAAFAAFFISTEFYQVLLKIIGIFKNPYDLDSEAYKKGEDEIQLIKNNILSVIDRNKKIEEDLAKRLALLNEAQVTTLQTQLNPHFLFNTLHLISSMEMVQAKKETDVTRAIATLSELLRVSLDSQEYFFTLEEEIQYAQKYLEIQSMKYKNRFTVIWEIAEETLPLKLFKLTLQPILENAIHHGILPSPAKGEIVIKTALEQQKFIICVADNGIGMPKEHLEDLNRQLAKVTLRKSSHFGLINTSQRYKLIFGDACTCRVSSDENGTLITLSFPVIRNEDKHLNNQQTP